MVTTDIRPMVPVDTAGFQNTEVDSIIDKNKRLYAAMEIIIINLIINVLEVMQFIRKHKMSYTQDYN
jgi:DNA-directed RNA polymerase beta' subunit